MALKGDMVRNLEKAHIDLLRHPETQVYQGILMLGESLVREDIPTACTNGRDKYYGKKYCSELNTMSELRAVIMHENIHVANRHLSRHKDLFKEDPQLANAAADYVVNLLVAGLADKNFLTIGNGWLLNQKFENWSVREVYAFLKNGQDKTNPSPNKPPKYKRGDNSVSVDGKEYSIGNFDQHDTTGYEDLPPEQQKEIERQIDEALAEAAAMAGIKGLNLPRGFNEALTPEVDWASETKDFASTYCRGKEDYTWRRFNARRLVDDLYLPSTHSEKLTEMILANDMSGSICGDVLKKAIGATADAAQICNPDRVRILWWDTNVCSEQIFEGNYSEMLTALKPRGGGGTRVGCVSDYIKEKQYNADCLVVLTDGFVESNPRWEISNIPTLWLVTGNDSWVPPAGQKVKVNG